MFGNPFTFLGGTRGFIIIHCVSIDDGIKKNYLVESVKSVRLCKEDVL